MKYAFDIECYVNYFLIVFLPKEGAPLVYEKLNDTVLQDDTAKVDFDNGTFISFNGNNYDMPLVGCHLAKMTNTQLKFVSDSIITKRMMPWIVEQKFGISIPKFNHIDIMQVLPQMASLKIYGGRIHSKKLQDLPLDPSTIITADQIPLMRDYCMNSDCVVTWELCHEVSKQIELRERMGQEYGLDLRSKSDAQIAEAVIASEYEKATDLVLQKPQSPVKRFQYTPPDFVKFRTQNLGTVLSTIMLDVFKVKESNGQVAEPASLKRKIEVGGANYKLGLGGLHSVDGGGTFHSDENYAIFDIDVASYYPAIILNAEFYPEHIGRVFLDIYKRLVDTRLDAKRSGDKVVADSLKIVINGTFGKLGSKYSRVYSPDLMAHVTVTGQLCLLMLIERFDGLVLSANTDGITVRIPQMDVAHYQRVVGDWERETGFVMEWTEYKTYSRRDVNNYLAITTDGEVKTKGVFATPGLSKNPANSIIYKAIKAHLFDGTSIRQVVENSTDITEFISLRTVNGGAKWGDELLGKSVRWYRGIDGKQIEYQTNGNKVPLSDGAIVVQDLPEEFPFDIDYDWYIDEAVKLMGDMAI